MHHSFPWHLVRRIGVRTPSLKLRVESVLETRAEMPAVQVRPEWYY